MYLYIVYKKYEQHVVCKTGKKHHILSFYLANYVLVSEANNKTVLGRVVLVLILGHQTFAGKIISFTLCK